MGDSNSGRSTRTTGATAAASLLARLSGVHSTLVLILCCCSCRAGVYSSARTSSTYPVRALQLSMSGLAYAATSCFSSGGAFCTARGGSRRAWSWRQGALITAIGRGAVEERRGGASRRAVGVARGVWMKANKKNKRKRQQQRQGNNAAGGEQAGNEALHNLSCFAVLYVADLPDSWFSAEPCVPTRSWLSCWCGGRTVPRTAVVLTGRAQSLFPAGLRPRTDALDM